MPLEEPDSPSYQPVEHGHPRNRVGCASEIIVLENVEQSPSGEPFSDDYPTIAPHNSHHDQGLSVSASSGKRSGSVYTNSLHIVRTHLVRKGGRIYYRRRVPDALRAIVGKKEVWRSLGTDSVEAARFVAANLSKTWRLAFRAK